VNSPVISATTVRFPFPAKSPRFSRKPFAEPSSPWPTILKTVSAKANLLSAFRATVIPQIPTKIGIFVRKNRNHSMNIDRYINEDQDPKTVEKILLKLQDMLDPGELVTYIAVQKKPAVTLLPDSIVLTNKRIFLCEFSNLGLSTNFEIFDWVDLKTITFKEEFFGSKFTVVPVDNENLTVDYIPKIQARKLYQLAKEAMEKHQSQLNSPSQAQPIIEASDDRPNDYQSFKLQPEEEPTIKEEPVSEEDELTQKLKKLKTLFDKQLITKD